MVYTPGPISSTILIPTSLAPQSCKPKPTSVKRSASSVSLLRYLGLSGENHILTPKGPIMNDWSQGTQCYQMMLSFAGQPCFSKGTFSNFHHSPRTSYLTTSFLVDNHSSYLKKKQSHQNCFQLCATKPTHHLLPALLSP